FEHTDALLHERVGQADLAPDAAHPELTLAERGECLRDRVGGVEVVLGKPRAHIRNRVGPVLGVMQLAGDLDDGLSVDGHRSLPSAWRASEWRARNAVAVVLKASAPSHCGQWAAPSTSRNSLSGMSPASRLPSSASPVGSLSVQTNSAGTPMAAKSSSVTR